MAKRRRKSTDSLRNLKPTELVQVLREQIEKKALDGKTPFDAALGALYEKQNQIKAAITIVEKLRKDHVDSGGVP